MNILIKPLEEEDYFSVSEIYRHGIETGNATFEKDVPDWNCWDSAHLKICRLVAYVDSKIIGWAALTPVSDRHVYTGVAEVSVYVSDEYKGQKVGTRLLEKLIIESEKHGIWTLQAVVFPENIASLKMHEKLGFRKVGFREKIGKMNGVWRDTLLLERRSRIAGIWF